MAMGAIICLTGEVLGMSIKTLPVRLNQSAKRPMRGWDHRHLQWMILMVFGISSGTPALYGLSLQESVHLLTRTGFAPSPAEIEAFTPLSRQEAVNQLLAHTRTSGFIAPPLWSQNVASYSPQHLHLKRRQSNRQEKKKINDGLRQQARGLQAYWLAEMAHTPSPMTENLTIFWHNYFPVSFKKVTQPMFMLNYLKLLRHHSSGNFRAMLHDIAKDPAMLRYLDGAQNFKKSPNENFAREVMELFTVGTGVYSEKDVKEAARAFTGWGIHGKNGRFRMFPGRHDPLPKVVLGQTVHTGEDVLDVLLNQSKTAERVTRRLWFHFVGRDPDPVTLTRISEKFQQQSYDLKFLMREILNHDEFWAARNRGTAIKSPAEMVVGFVRQFAISDPSADLMAKLTRQWGMELLAPPNVKGWAGGRSWINTGNIIPRENLYRRLTQQHKSTMMMAAGFKPDQWLQRAMKMSKWKDRMDPKSSKVLKDHVIERLLVLPPVYPDRLRNKEGGKLLAQIVSDPAYQLK